MELLRAISVWAIPFMLLFIPLYAFVRGVRVYEVFCEGAKEGFATAVRIMPYLVAMFVALAVFRESFALAGLLNLMQPIADLFGFPREVLPLALVRPLSGSGALAVLADILSEYGPDSLIGIMASTMQGSTETTFYILTVYFGAVGVNRLRHTAVVGLLADLAGFAAAVIIVTLVFR